MLARSGIPYDIVTDIGLTPAKLAKYECLLLPASAALSDDDVDMIRAYVEDGGHVIGLFDATLFAPDGRRREDLGLAGVFGVSFDGSLTDYKTWNFFSPSGPHPVFDGIDVPLYPAPPTGLDVSAREGADVLARFHAPLEGRYSALTAPDKPAVVLNRTGRGQALFLAGSFGEMNYERNPAEYRQMMANAVRLFTTPPARLSGQVGNIEVVVRKQGERLLIHLVNYAGLPPRPFEALAPQRDLQVCLPAYRGEPGTVRALMSGEDCSFAPGEDGLVIDVPVLNDYEVITVE
jgi:hypothetical protein